MAGIEVTLDPTGALYWNEERTLVVSDLHLETGSSYARTGQMLPPYDTSVTLRALREAVDRHGPERLIFLGDSFHDPFGAERLGEAERRTLTRLAARLDVVWITGNHDRHGASQLGGHTADVFILAGLTFRHIPSEGEPLAPEVAGHLHPAAVVCVRGRTLKRRCFIGCDRRIVLPALGSLTGGLSVTDRAFVNLWPHDARPRVHLIGRERVYSLQGTIGSV